MANCELMVGVAWQREPPDSEGDWLWVEVGEFDVEQIGLCSVTGLHPEDEPDEYFPPGPENAWRLALWWVGAGPVHGIEVVTAWARLNLPSAEAVDSGAPGDSLTALEADYQILVAARGWPHEERAAFCDALRDIWGERAKPWGWPSQWAILYESGDYARAATKAKEVQGE